MRASTLIILLLILCRHFSVAQQITGVWKGRINGKNAEVKIIQKGDSLTGTSYYPGLAKNYRRYSIKGYFDQEINSVVWWDDKLIVSKANTTDRPFMSVADFNCPGGGRMYLNGKSSSKEDHDATRGSVSLTKVDHSSFQDEWDYVLDNFGFGGNDPYIIDSISRIAFEHRRVPEPVSVKVLIPKQTPPSRPVAMVTPPVQKEIPVKIIPGTKLPPKPLTIDEMFSLRTKIFNKEIALSGDSIELRFYDNAEVDGDSISLFLNDKLIFTHIRLTANPYTIMLPVKELNENNELVMVAENLGSIPPNTAYMVAMVGDKRYDAQLESSENSSCLIRLKK